MKTVMKVTGLKHWGIKEIHESIVPSTAEGAVRGNSCEVIRELNEDGTDGIAYRVECKGVKIGYIPEVASLQRYADEAEQEGNWERAEEYSIGVEECERLRKRFGREFESTGTMKWTGVIHFIKWVKDGKVRDEKWKTFDQMTEKDFADGYEPALLSIELEM